MENETTGLSVDQLNRETESASRHSSNGQILWSKEIKHGTEAQSRRDEQTGRRMRSECQRVTRPERVGTDQSGVYADAEALMGFHP